jgi:peptidoglycan biosynthesis protein MviN/MurJ (putative lipid II flippase)
VLLLAVILVSRWAFGEELPAVAKLLAYGVLAGGVASLIIAVTGFIRELRKSRLLAKQT